MKDKKDKIRQKEMKKSTYLFLMVLFLMLTVTGGTYAYFALSATKENAIIGTAATTGLELKVEKMSPSGTVGVMVPQLEAYLNSAISTNYNCVDDNGNTVCQVYKATITNRSTSAVKLDGTMSFTGIENMPNLKWKRITDERTIGEYPTNKATTYNTEFDTDIALTKNGSASYYFVIWINETGSAQTDSGTFKVTIEFNPAGGDGLTSTIGTSGPNAYATAIMSPSVGNGVQVFGGTENDKNPIYFYYGDVTNNNLIFADFCWKVVRTTETGGLKLIYNGVPSNGQCNNTGDATEIGKSLFSAPTVGQLSPIDVGYMYGTSHYTFKYTDVMSNSIQYTFGDGVTYSDGVYTLTNPITVTWSEWQQNGLGSNRYWCGNTGVTPLSTCETVRYAYLYDSIDLAYIELTGGEEYDVDLVIESLDDNTTSSTIKTAIDDWYYTNIEDKGYTNYLEDTVWCNDRSIAALQGFDPSYRLPSVTDLSYVDFCLGLTYGTIGRLLLADPPSPSFSCSRPVDSFTVNSSNGNGALTYPVGLLTADEIAVAGIGTSSNTSNYLYTGSEYWTGTPVSFNLYPLTATIAADGRFDFRLPYSVSLNLESLSIGVRPSISLKSGFALTGNGDGTATSPYRVG